MNSEVDYLFPTLIYRAENILPSEEKSKIIEKVIEKSSLINEPSKWNCNTTHSMNQFDLREDNIFLELNKKIIDCVNDFALHFNSNHTYQINSSWFNISRENNFQEYHIHKNSIFSAVYYLSSPQGSGEIIFQNPNDKLDMCSLHGLGEINPFNSTYHYYEPKENSVLIFRSYLYHMVRIGTNESPRISLAYNFS